MELTDFEYTGVETSVLPEPRPNHQQGPSRPGRSGTRHISSWPSSLQKETPNQVSVLVQVGPVCALGRREILFRVTVKQGHIM